MGAEVFIDPLISVLLGAKLPTPQERIGSSLPQISMAQKLLPLIAGAISGYQQIQVQHGLPNVLVAQCVTGKLLLQVVMDKSWLQYLLMAKVETVLFSLHQMVVPHGVSIERRLVLIISPELRQVMTVLV